MDEPKEQDEPSSGEDPLEVGDPGPPEVELIGESDPGPPSMEWIEGTQRDEGDEKST